MVALALLVLGALWLSWTVSPVVAQEEDTPTPTLTATPAATPTPGSSVEEVFTLGSGSTFVVEHSASYGEITIVAVLLILIYVAWRANENRKKAWPHRRPGTIGGSSQQRRAGS